jgi:hypothetical protein
MSSPTKSAVQDDPALREMEQLLEEWRLLTGAEKEAINAEDWDRLAILQQRKVSCQRLIEDAELQTSLRNWFWYWEEAEVGFLEARSVEWLWSVCFALCRETPMKRG